MQYRKRTNLTKRRTLPSEGGRSTSGKTPVRFPSLPAHLRNRPRDNSETGAARLERLVRDTPGCRVCGSHTGLVYRKIDGKDIYECPDHINDRSTYTSRQVKASSERVRHKPRYLMSEVKDGPQNTDS